MNILTINAGSSSLKASFFHTDGHRQNYHYRHLENGDLLSFRNSFIHLFKELYNNIPDIISHRFVHGGEVNGEICDKPRLIDEIERARLAENKHFAPLHMPLSLLGVDLCKEHFNCTQLAIFDTAFHSTLPELAYRLPIPSKFGLRRYGYHGINYSHVANMLPKILGDFASGKIIVAHLGNGASLCLMKNLKSVDTTMGYSTAGGIPMSTRSGDLDPGVMLILAKRFSYQMLSELVYGNMGLNALSNEESSDMAELLESKTESASFAVNFFAQQVRAAIGSFAAKIGGVDGLVFTGGIGENSTFVRDLICRDLKFLGFSLDSDANSRHSMTLNKSSSKPILIIPADEEAEMARLTTSNYSSPVQV